MTEKQLQFRVGLFVIAAMVAAGAMILKFGDLQAYFQPQYTVWIHFDAAPGVRPSTPVRKNGIQIGSVQDLAFDEQNGGVLLKIQIREGVLLRRDAQPRLVRSLLGDAAIDVIPGEGSKFLQAGERLNGRQQQGPMDVVNRLETTVAETMDSFNATSREWQKVARNLNGLLQTNSGNLEVVLERTAQSLEQFTRTMQTAERTFADTHELINDPENMANLRRTLEALPRLAEETQQTITAVRGAVQKMDQNLKTLNDATEPLALKSASIVNRLDRTMANVESVSTELNAFTRRATREDGTLHRFAADPQLYRNLNRSAESLTVLLRNLEPILRDVRIFSDKVARHPELLGFSGALKGSSGLKDPPPGESEFDSPLRQSNFQRGEPQQR